MRCIISLRTFLVAITLSIFLVLYLHVKEVKDTNTTLRNNISSIQETVSSLKNELNDIKQMNKPKIEMKYILQWTSGKNVPFVYMGHGQQGFIDRNCSHVNCFVTSNRYYFDDLTKFDVIAFAGPEVVRLSKPNLPNKRSPHQKYAFATIESADNYPVCSKKLDNFFNWTWTYRTDSTARWGYMAIRDSSNKIIGPNTDMHWVKLSDMDPVNDELKGKLKSKKKAAAWFVSNCHTRSARERFVEELQEKLKKYDLSVDVYGRCGPLKCSTDREEDCFKMLEMDYYFYLSFENSFATDYVTEKLLHALTNNAIPIVYGAANYTRFMPDGIYLNARELGAEKLADKINELISHPDEYAEYFRWQKYYSYHRRFKSIETDDYCRFCSMLYEEDLVKEISTYPNFKEWWDPPYRC